MSDPIADEEINQRQQDDGLLDAEAEPAEAVQQQERNDGCGKAEQFAYRHAAVAIEIGQEPAERCDAGAEHCWSPVEIEEPGARCAVSGPQDRGEHQVSAVTGHDASFPTLGRSGCPGGRPYWHPVPQVWLLCQPVLARACL